VSTQHTPGPWRIHEATESPQIGVVANLGEKPWTYASAWVSRGNKIIAETTMQCGAVGGFPRVQVYEEMMSNARLIAAAPELLAACEALLRLYGPDGDFASNATKTYDAARAAIAKATMEVRR
jgi:hypothetical protein